MPAWDAAERAAAEEDADDAEPWFRHPWEDEPAEQPPSLAPVAPAASAHGPAGQALLDEAAPPGSPAPPGPLALLGPLAAASAALARLDARLAAADPAVAEGVRARLALREAAGWLAHQNGAWVHPIDLGLREAGLTGSVTAAALRGRLRATLPATLAAADPDAAPVTPGAPVAPVAEDPAIAQALQLGRLWRRLAEQRGWAPLADAAALRPLLAQLGCHTPAEDALADWLSRCAGRAGGTGRAGRIGRGGLAGATEESGAVLPALLRAGLAAQAWSAWEPPGQGRADRLATPGLFLAACVWRRLGSTPSLALPLWSATPQRLETLALTAGPAWLAGFLTAVADAAQRGGQELTRLQTAAERASALRRTARSQLPAAASLALRQPVLTARGVAERLRLSPQAALTLLKQLVAAGVLRETTGRAAWRAFAVM